jgi:hypothetical protein
MDTLIMRDFRTNIVSLGTMTFDNPSIGKLRTIERPWKDNQQIISCIPTGIWVCERDMYYGGDGVGGKQDYECFEIRDVPDREEIKLHIANYVRQVVGCIGIGLTRDKKIPAVWNSSIAFKKFMEIQEGCDKFTLEIRNG